MPYHKMSGAADSLYSSQDDLFTMYRLMLRGHGSSVAVAQYSLKR